MKWHPDRVPADSPERPKRTKKFQAINDAYYTLSDSTRRKDYDERRKFHTGSFSEDDEEEGIPQHQPPKTSGSFFSFGGRRGSQEEKFANEQFEGAFAEMMDEAAMASDTTDNGDSQAPKRGVFWSILGGLSGASLGFIIANFPGAATGAVVGAKLGGLRDSKHQSVYATFQELPQNDRARMLSELAARLFAGAIS